MTELNKKWQSLPHVVWKATKQGKPATECHMEGRHGLTKASLSVLEGMGGAVLQEIGGLGGHALQHQVQAARVAGSQGEAQDDHLHLLHCLRALTSIATLPAPAMPSLTHTHWLESEIHKVRLGSQGLQNTGALMNEQKHERSQCSKECAAVMHVCLMLWHLARWRSLRATLGPCSSQEGPVPVSRVATLLSELCWSASSAEDASPTPTCQALTHWCTAA